MEREYPLGYQQITELIPHRFPFLLIDQIVEFKKEERIIGKKNVTANEWFFEGHFPERPLMPGVLILEALAQLGVLYAQLLDDSVVNKKLAVFAGADKVKFKRPVVPGDVLTLEMIENKRRSTVWVMEGRATVNGELVCSGMLTAATID